MKFQQATASSAQLISVLLLRAQQGDHEGTFAASDITTRSGYKALVGNIPEEFDGLITIQTAEGPVEVPAAGLSCTIALSEKEWEQLNGQPLNAYVATGMAVISMNTKSESRNTRYADNKKLKGSLWIEPVDEFDCAPAAGRATSKQAVLDAVQNNRQNRSEFFATRAAANQTQTAKETQQSKLSPGVSAK